MKKIKTTLALLLTVFTCIVLPSCGILPVSEAPKVSRPPVSASEGGYTIDTVPEYKNDAFVEINNNVPYFESSEYMTEAYEYYSDLDELGRCGFCVACVCRETMPSEKRGNISQVKPTGWQSIKYDFVDGKSLYNRCHLIGFQLTAENANEKNLITGTRYLNVEGMLPFENMVADYVKETSNHVMYRVTPVFSGNELVARGVEMEAYSVEDNGEGVCFNIYAYNIQPNVVINYADGTSREQKGGSTSEASQDSSDVKKYVINTKNKKVHLPDCGSVASIKSENKKTVTSSLSELIAQGYSPCGSCLSKQ